MICLLFSCNERWTKRIVDRVTITYVEKENEHRLCHIMKKKVSFPVKMYCLYLGLHKKTDIGQYGSIIIIVEQCERINIDWNDSNCNNNKILRNFQTMSILFCICNNDGMREIEESVTVRKDNICIAIDENISNKNFKQMKCLFSKRFSQNNTKKFHTLVS